MSKLWRVVTIVFLSALLLAVTTALIVTVEYSGDGNNGSASALGNRIGYDGNGSITVSGEGETVSTPFYVTDMYPGDSITRTYTVRTGDRAMKNLYFTAVKTQGTVFGDMMTLTVKADETVLYSGPLRSVSGFPYLLQYGDNVRYSVTVALAQAAGNEYADLFAAFSFGWSFAYVDTEIPLVRPAVNAPGETDTTDMDIRPTLRDGTQVYRYEFRTDVGGEVSLYCTLASGDLPSDVSDVLWVRLECEEDGKILYDGLLSEMPEKMSVRTKNKPGATVRYRVTFVPVAGYEDIVATCTDTCACTWSAGPTTMGDIAIILLVVLCFIEFIVIALFILYGIGAHENKRLVKHYRSLGYTAEEMRELLYRRREYIKLGCIVLFTEKKK